MIKYRVWNTLHITRLKFDEYKTNDMAIDGKKRYHLNSLIYISCSFMQLNVIYERRHFRLL